MEFVKRFKYKWQLHLWMSTVDFFKQYILLQLHHPYCLIYRDDDSYILVGWYKTRKLAWEIGRLHLCQHLGI